MIRRFVFSVLLISILLVTASISLAAPNSEVANDKAIINTTIHKGTYTDADNDGFEDDVLTWFSLKIKLLHIIEEQYYENTVNQPSQVNNQYQSMLVNEAPNNAAGYNSEEDSDNHSHTHEDTHIDLEKNSDQNHDEYIPGNDGSQTNAKDNENKDNGKDDQAKDNGKNNGKDNGRGNENKDNGKNDQAKDNEKNQKNKDKEDNNKQGRDHEKGKRNNSEKGKDKEKDRKNVKFSTVKTDTAFYSFNFELVLKLELPSGRLFTYSYFVSVDTRDYNQIYSNMIKITFWDHALESGFYNFSVTIQLYDGGHASNTANLVFDPPGRDGGSNPPPPSMTIL